MICHRNPLRSRDASRPANGAGRRHGDQHPERGESGRDHEHRDRHVTSSRCSRTVTCRNRRGAGVAGGGTRAVRTVRARRLDRSPTPRWSTLRRPRRAHRPRRSSDPADWCLVAHLVADQVDVDDEVDGLGDQAPHRELRQSGVGLRHVVGETVQHDVGRVGMDRRQRSALAHRGDVEHVERLVLDELADDDAVGVEPARELDELTGRDLALPFGVGMAGEQRRRVGMAGVVLEVQFEEVLLDGDDPLAWRHLAEQLGQQRGLPGAWRARHEDREPAADHRRQAWHERLGEHAERRQPRSPTRRITKRRIAIRGWVEMPCSLGRRAPSRHASRRPPGTSTSATTCRGDPHRCGSSVWRAASGRRSARPPTSRARRRRACGRRRT